MNLPRLPLACLIAFLLFAGIGAYWTHMGQQLYRNEQRFYMSELVNGQVSTIERRLTRQLASTRILAQAVLQSGGQIDDFERFADEILHSFDGVSNLQLAPAGVVQFIHPLEGNEKAIGHNILADDKRRREANQAIQERRLSLAGPFELVQGGVAVIGRNPVFLDTDQGQQFWGFSSALIRLEDLLEVTDLDPTGAKGYSFQLSRTDSDSGQSTVFLQSTTALTKDSYTADINVPGAVWTLQMSRSTPTPKWRSTTGYIASLLAGLLAAWIAAFVLRQPEKLRKVVEQKTQQLQQLAYHDPLTELANRRHLTEQLERVVREYDRYRKPAVLVYLDLDDFKRINDSMGHDAGDGLLRQVAGRLTGCVRESDLVARLGGDEFGILLLDAQSVEDVSRIAEKLIETIEQPVPLGNKSFVVSTSIGIAMIPADGRDVTSILSHADMAMYSAKRAGKRNYRFFDKALQRKAMAKLQLEHDLVEATAQSQFFLHYQPIIELSSGRIGGYEALIRWQHPDRGLLYPDRFIWVAEETGRIVEIGYWVIAQACRQLQQFRQAQDDQLTLSVNLSPRQFKDPALLENIRTILRSTEVSASRLELEVTESSVMEDVDQAIDTLQQLKILGVRVAIDDFGTGYSSFSSLKHLPVDRIKIDRSFIRDLETNQNDRQIVQGLISMSHKLELSVVAEGVEFTTQQALLETYGCDFAQGFLFSRPVPIEQLWPLREPA